MNRLLLSARLVQREALRHTPAGLPALDVQLLHASEQPQDGPPRKLSFSLKALAIGAAHTGRLAALPLGQEARFAGFLAPSRNGKGLVLQITEIET
jgi:primosomal replication protein N